MAITEAERIMESVVKAVDTPYPGSQWDTGKKKEKDISSRSKACPKCGMKGTLTQFTDDDKNKYYECSHCGLKSQRPGSRGPSGPKQNESHVKKMRDIGDKVEFHGMRVSGLSHPASLWLAWGHTSLCSRDNDMAKGYFERLRWYLYLEVARKVELSDKDEVEILFARLFTLVECVIRERKKGAKKYSVRELSTLTGVDHTHFSSDRRWARIKEAMEYIVNSWESEILLNAQLDTLQQKS